MYMYLIMYEKAFLILTNVVSSILEVFLVI